MLALSSILEQYPLYLRQFPKAILREYLQIKILSYVANHPYHHQLCFIWWTALRLMYHSQRFSEDLDFDNRWLSSDQFDQLGYDIKKQLELLWLEVDLKLVHKWAYHASIKIPQLLYDQKLSPLSNEKLVIKIDTTAQWYDYDATSMMVNSFEHIYQLRTVPKSILLSMKWRALCERVKGRDLYDIVYLLWLWAKTHRWYIQHFYPEQHTKSWKEYILARIETFDLEALQYDVAPFLFDPTNQSVKLFPQIIDQIQFE